jgi:glycosyltransferase involved in cell wall biosynthesis
MIVKDAEKTLVNTLNSLKNFTEVIIYENGSTDSSVEIAKQYSNVRVIKGEFKGFGRTKNIASTYASNEWVFSLDSDEVLSDKFIESLKKLVLDDSTLYQINRVNYYKETLIRYCWAHDNIVRLYNKTKTSYTDADVHEKIIIDGFKVSMILGNIKHYPYSSISEFIKKADYYSTLFAQDRVGKKSSSPLKALLNALYSFIKTFIFKRGFMDGYVGLIIAYSHMVTNFYKYIKLYELNLEKIKRDEV